MLLSIKDTLYQQKKSSHLGLRDAPRWRSASYYLLTFIIVLGSVRGAIVLYLGLSTQIVYNGTAALLIILSAYGCLKSGQVKKNPELLFLKKLLLLNVFLGIVNVGLDVRFGIPFSPSAFYLYLLPYVVFLFLRVPASYLNVAFTIITIAISYSVFDNFVETQKGLSGYQDVFTYNMKLRPDTFEALSRTDEYYRAAGFTGNYHDSANILGMTGSFFFIRYLVRRKWFDLGLSVIALYSLTLTQSATNIVVAIFTCVIFTSYVLFFNRKIKTFIVFGIMAVVITVMLLNFSDVLTIFTKRFTEEAFSEEGILNQLNMDSLMSACMLFFSGHATGYGSKIINVEITHIKMLFQLGIVHAYILFWVLLYPILCFLKVRSFCTATLPAVAAIFFGFMSLLHYASLFRSTSILIFYAIYTICLADAINYNDSMRLSGRESSERGLGVRSAP